MRVDGQYLGMYMYRQSSVTKFFFQNSRSVLKIDALYFQLGFTWYPAIRS